MSDCVHPCPCGWINDPQKACGCAPAVVTKYQKRISGPLLDRIDIHIEVLCRLPNEGQSLMRAVMTQPNLLARAYHRILKLARTIADLAVCEEIQSEHLGEALHIVPMLSGNTGRS